MELAAGIENVTEPGDALHWGDTVRVHLTGAPKGAPVWHVEVAAYGNREDWPQPGTYADRGSDRDPTPSFVLGTSSAGPQAGAEWDDTGNVLIVYFNAGRKGILPVGAPAPLLGRR